MQACLQDYFKFHAERHPDILFAQDDAQSLSKAAAYEKVLRIAGAFQAAGLGSGDRIALIGKNSVDQLLLFFACAFSGVVPVPLNYRLAANEWSFIVEDSEAKYLFIDAEFADLLEPQLAQLPKAILFGEHREHGSFNRWIEHNSKAFTGTSVSPQDILFQIYTSGTTGSPKGVLLNHSNVTANAYQTTMTNSKYPLPGDRVLVIAPLYHAGGLVGALVAINFGASLFIMRDFNPQLFIETLAREKIKRTTAVPVMLQFAINNVPNIESYDFSSLDVITYGASAISEDLLQKAMAVFGCDFGQGYGQTEATAGLTMLTSRDHIRALEEKPELLRSAGKPLFGTEIKLVDDKGREVPTGEAGEIVARGPQLMQGYWNRPEATLETLVEGWLHTGDIGRMDDEGYIYILDRKKDLIISGGENIYPVEIENTLMKHPDISDVAVIGVPDEKWGEVPMAIVVPQKDTETKQLTIPEIDEFCRDKIAGYKIPKHLGYIEELPRNPSGKVLKNELRAQFAKQS